MPNRVREGVARGQIYWVNIPEEETRGSEQYKERPWLVVSGDCVHKQIPLVLAIPLSTKLSQAGRFRGCRIRIPQSEISDLGGGGGFKVEDKLALVEQVRALSHERLGKPVGKISKDAFAYIEAALAYVFDLAY